MAAPNDIVHFHYPFSPFARRVTWYLTLRHIAHAECLQPPYLPRPDLAALGIHYRRIPLLSIGRSIYCDTRLILHKLESLPDIPSALPPLHSSTTPPLSPSQTATQQLLENWTIDGGIFMRAAQLLPPDLPLMQDAKFQKDREDLMGRKWDPDTVKSLRPEALVHIRQAFDFLEQGLLADGREWILGTEKPSLADIDTVWPFHWLVLGLRTALPEELVSGKTHPKVWAWIERFDKAVKTEAGKMPRVKRLKGPEAREFVTSGEFSEDKAGMEIDKADPVGQRLREGQLVASWPVDTGFRHQDVGRLVKLDREEVVLEVEGEGGKVVRLHHPRRNFRVRAVGDGAKI